METRDQTQFEHVLNTGKPLRDLRPSFPSWEAALNEYGKVQAAAHAADRDVDVCEACRQAPPEVTQNISWSAMVYKAKWLFWSVLVSLITVIFDFTVEKSLCISFTTQHHLCKRCYRVQKTKQALYGLMNPILFGLLILSLIALVPLIVVGGYFGWEAGPVGLLAFIAGTVTTVGFLLGIISLCSRIPNLVISKHIRPIGRRPFTMTRIQKIG